MYNLILQDRLLFHVGVGIHLPLLVGVAPDSDQWPPPCLLHMLIHVSPLPCAGFFRLVTRTTQIWIDHVVSLLMVKF